MGLLPIRGVNMAADVPVANETEVQLSCVASLHFVQRSRDIAFAIIKDGRCYTGPPNDGMLKSNYC